MFAGIKDIDHLIKHSSEIEGIKKEVAKNYDNIVNKILNIENNYLNNLKPQEIGKIGDVTIFLIDGDVIEKMKDMDFVEGGHDLVYDFIPDKTIWIDVSLDTDSFKYLILHEYIERSIMEKIGFRYKGEYNEKDESTYHTIHEIANDFEKKFRKQTSNISEI